MKYLLIILLSCMHDCYAQKKLTFEQADSLSKANVPINAKWDTVSSEIIYYQTFDTNVLHFIKPLVKQKNDTLIVIMLLCDTSERSADNLNQVYWDIGYEVRDSYDNQKTYLDIDKKKLSTNLIVWQSKEF